jgi:small subunit ribosomal protein S20
MGKRAKSGIKRTRSSAKRHDRNLDAKIEIKKALKAAEKGIAAKASDVKELINKAISVIDKAVTRGIVHRNKAARKKSRLMVKLAK